MADDYTILALIIGAPRVSIERLAAMLRAPDLQDVGALLLELRPPWWQRLRPRIAGASEWDRVRPARDGVLVTHGDGRVYRQASVRAPDGHAVKWDVYDIDFTGERIQVLDIRSGFPTGLYVRAADCAPVE